MITTRRAALTLLASPFLAACTTATKLPATAEATDDAPTTLRRFPAGERPMAPDLNGPTLTGGTLHLADLKGHVVVLNAWASWCGPCREESPELAKAHRTLRARGVRVIGLNVNDSESAARSFVEDEKLPYPSIHDPKGKQALRLPRGSIPQGLPYTVFIDPDGRIAAVQISTVTAADIDRVTGSLVRP